MELNHELSFSSMLANSSFFSHVKLVKCLQVVTLLPWSCPGVIMTSYITINSIKVSLLPPKNKQNKQTKQMAVILSFLGFFQHLFTNRQQHIVVYKHHKTILIRLPTFEKFLKHPVDIYKNSSKV